MRICAYNNYINPEGGEQRCRIVAVPAAAAAVLVAKSIGRESPGRTAPGLSLKP